MTKYTLDRIELLAGIEKLAEKEPQWGIFKVIDDIKNTLGVKDITRVKDAEALTIVNGWLKTKE